MRNFKIFLLLAAMTLVSCSDLLDEVPKDFKDPDKYYNTDTAIIQSANGLYSRLKQGGIYGKNLPFVVDIYGGCNRVSSSEYDNFTYAGTNTMPATNTILTQVWQHHYRAINDCNTTIERVTNSQGDLTPSLRARVIGEAKFIRALLYFNLVRCWDEVPLRTERMTHTASKDTPLASIKEIYDLIISDLQYAEENLWDRGEVVDGVRCELGRATQLAAKHLLAKVYLTIASSRRYAGTDGIGAAANNPSFNKCYSDNYTESDAAEYYQRAKDIAQEAIGHKDFEMLDEVKDIWDMNNQNNPEMIFAVQYASGANYGSSFFTFYTPKESMLNQPKAGGIAGFSINLYTALRDADTDNQGRPIDRHDYDSFLFKFWSDKARVKGGNTDYLNLDGDKRITDALLLDYEATADLPLSGNSKASWQDWSAGGLKYAIFDPESQKGYKTVSSDGKLYYAKWIDEGCAITATSSLDFPVLRSSELYLILAEATVALSGVPADGFDAYNVVRRRGNENRLLEGGDVALTDYMQSVDGVESPTIVANDALANYPGETDVERFNNAILRERLMEFMGEGYHFFDLKRLGQLSKFTSILAQGGKRSMPFQYYWPIPQSEMDTNNAIIAQKQGY